MASDAAKGAPGVLSEAEASAGAASSPVDASMLPRVERFELDAEVLDESVGLEADGAAAQASTAQSERPASSTGGQAGHPQSEHDDGSIEQSVEQQSVEMEQVCDAWVCACVMGLEVNTLREKPSNACYVDARERREHAWPAAAAMCGRPPRPAAALAGRCAAAVDGGLAAAATRAREWRGTCAHTVGACAQATRASAHARATARCVR